MKRNAGFMMMDTIFGIMIVLALMAGLAITLHQEHGALVQLAERREVAEPAEAALLDMQLGRKAVADAPIRITMRDAKGGAAVAGRKWITVRAERGKWNAEVTGLVPVGGKP